MNNTSICSSQNCKDTGLELKSFPGVVHRQRRNIKTSASNFFKLGMIIANHTKIKKNIEKWGPV